AMTSASGCSVIVFAWTLPIRPAPMMPKRIMVVSLRLGQNNVADEGVEVRVIGEEAAQRANCRAEGVELLGCHAVRLVGAADLVDFEKLVEDFLWNRVVEALNHGLAGVVDALLPLERRGNNDVSADELGVVHGVAESGGEHAGLESA